jgi:PTH1 family peptidyl-tRNA hydrolase
MKYLIAGLGNIGAEYEATRHNIGFMVLDQLAKKHEAIFKTERYADAAVLKLKGRTLLLIKPNTYMNLSGKAVSYWMQKEKIPKPNLLVVMDDLALPFGKIRMRKKGSNAGHNGLASIDQLTGGNDYPRLRFGIGNDFSRGKQVEYVLSMFNPEEQESLEEIVAKAVAMIEGFCTIGIDRAMNQYND